MYVAPVDAARSDDEWQAFVESQRFGQLIASGRDRDVPVVVPTQFVFRRPDLVLVHLVRRNPVFDAIAEQPAVMLSVAGDWAFVPSAWKAVGEEDPHIGIPTTYYAAAQLVGTARVLDEPDEIAALLRVQLDTFQPGVAVADPAVAHRPKLDAILGIELRVETVRAKFKFGGNVDRDHRSAVVERLLDRDGPGDRTAAAHVRRRSAAADQAG